METSDGFCISLYNSLYRNLQVCCCICGQRCEWNHQQSPDVDRSNRRSFGSQQSVCPSVGLIYSFHIFSPGIWGMCSTTLLSSFSAHTKLFGSSSSLGTKDWYLWFLFSKQRLLYGSLLTHNRDTNTFATTALHNLEYHHSGAEVYKPCFQPMHPLLPIKSSSVFSIWLPLSFMFTTGSSTILTAVGDHLFAMGLFPLATCFKSSSVWRLFKGGKVNKEKRRQVSQTVSHGYLSTSATHIWQSSDLKPQLLSHLFQTETYSKRGRLLTSRTLHFMTACLVGVTEKEAASL